MKAWSWGMVLCGTAVIATMGHWAVAQDGGGRPARAKSYPRASKAWPGGSLLLGNPTSNSVELVIHSSADATATVELGESENSMTQKSAGLNLKAAVPTKVKLGGLQPNTTYAYRLRFKRAGESLSEVSPTYRIQTQRKPGSNFTFLIQGDSHPERVPKMNVPSLYERTLLTASELKPDFYICMGDDFSVDTLRERTKDTMESVYQRQIPYLGLVAHSSPVFLVNGNHEQASKVNLDGTPNSLGVWTQTARNRNFAQPAPDDFYTGNTEEVPHIGLLRNYFAWTWGDALFVTIDPYWHSDKAVDNEAGKGPKAGGGKRDRNFWDITLGEKQYRWLSKTLLESRAKFKFVFAHHVHGTGRGGIELARLYEWGGQDRNGENVFSKLRPGWDMPIHDLFVKSGVSIFFQGHDHIFCKQVLDGVIYQSCPCPADPTNSLINGDAYRSGDKVPGAGLVRVDVSASQAKVQFIRAFEPSAETDKLKHGMVAFSYTVQPSKAGTR